MYFAFYCTASILPGTLKSRCSFSSMYIYHESSMHILIRASNKSCLLVTKNACPQDIYLFESNIPTSLLDHLHDPGANPKRATPFIINRTKIDLGHSHLRDRIVAELSNQSSTLDCGRRSPSKRQREAELEEGCKRQKN